MQYSRPAGECRKDYRIRIFLIRERDQPAGVMGDTDWRVAGDLLDTGFFVGEAGVDIG